MVAQPPWPLAARELRRSGARLIYDLYDPEPLEALQFLAGRRAGLRKTVTAMSLDRLVDALHDGHAFLCASDRQRDLWTGALLSQRLITPAVHDADPTLGGLLAVVPFGVPDSPPAPGPGPRERFGLAADDEIVLWNGGLWDWLDAESVLRAVARLSPERPRLRLVFMGTSGAAQARDAETRARELARELGLLGRVVRFNDGWVPYDAARRLAAPGRLRGRRPPRPPRDALRPPHAPARLPVGGPAGGLHPRRRRSPSGSSATTSAPPCRPRTPTPSPPPSPACSTAAATRTPSGWPQRRASCAGRTWPSRCAA